jgi:hypothetical protein
MSTEAAGPDRPHRTGSLQDILRRAGAVPPRTGFPLLDDLTAAFEALRARHPELVAAHRIGTSRQGEPITLYSVGAGRGSHLVVGGVHPNEPIGSWTALHLAEQLVDDAELRLSLDATWGIVPCIDPDGYRLNEGWFSGPNDRATYSRHFFRPAADEQVEWTFPFFYKKAAFDRMLPETTALRAAIDITRPDLYVALHNSEMGGVYYYLSRPEPALYDPLHRIAQHFGLPLNEGEPEAGYLTAYAPAIFADGTLEAAYDWMEALGLDPYPPGSGGNSSGNYAGETYGSLVLIAELPYWRTPEAADTRPVGETYAEVLHRTGAQIGELGDILEAAAAEAAGLVDWNTALAHGAAGFARMMSDAAKTSLARAALPDAARPATAAERFGCEDTVRMYRLRYGGMMLRALESSPSTSARLAAAVARMEEHYIRWQAEAGAADRSEPIPVNALVGVQYGATLLAASHLAGRLTP